VENGKEVDEEKRVEVRGRGGGEKKKEQLKHKGKIGGL